jgi:hypothetical protein
MPVLVCSTPDIIRRFSFHHSEIYKTMHHRCHPITERLSIENKKSSPNRLQDLASLDAHAHTRRSASRSYLSIPPVSLHPDPRLELALDHIE